MMHAWFLELAIWMALAALTLALMQWLLALRRVRQQKRQRITARLAMRSVNDASPFVKVVGPAGHLRVWLLRANLQLSLQTLMLLGFSLALVILLLALLVGMGVALLALLVVAFLCWAVWWRRCQSRRFAILEALPALMDAVVRGLDAGMTLEQALVRALEDAPDVYTELGFRVRAAVESGRDFAPIFDQFGELYRVPPLVMVSIGLSTSRRFGASVRPILLQTAQSLRSQEQLRRDFMALTSETRFSAVFFAVIPVLLGAVLLTLTPTYRQVLLHTDSGRHMMMMSIALVLLGIVWLYRMVQGVGRG